MASLAKYIEELQELERQNPGTQIYFGVAYQEAAYSNYQIVQRRLTKERKGVRWVAAKAKSVAFVVESMPKGKSR